MSKKREHWGDRPDGVLLRDLDSLHFITGIIYPNRCDNEAYITERIDLTNANAYLEKKNAENPEYKYNPWRHTQRQSRRPRPGRSQKLPDQFP